MHEHMSQFITHCRTGYPVDYLSAQATSEQASYMYPPHHGTYHPTNNNKVSLMRCNCLHEHDHNEAAQKFTNLLRLFSPERNMTIGARHFFRRSARQSSSGAQHFFAGAREACVEQKKIRGSAERCARARRARVCSGARVAPCCAMRHGAERRLLGALKT